VLLAVLLKYFWDGPIAVRYIGAIYGVFFVAFLYYLYEVGLNGGWNTRLNTIAFVCALVPFGTFWLNRELEKKAKESNLKPSP